MLTQRSGVWTLVWKTIKKEVDEAIGWSASLLGVLLKSLCVLVSCSGPYFWLGPRISPLLPRFVIATSQNNPCFKFLQPVQWLHYRGLCFVSIVCEQVFVCAPLAPIVNHFENIWGICWIFWQIKLFPCQRSPATLYAIRQIRVAKL